MSRPISTGTIATFRISDAACPDARQVLRQVGPELMVTGQVTYLSDSGDRKVHYAIIEVEGIHAPLIVRVDRLRVSGAGDSAAMGSRARSERAEAARPFDSLLSDRLTN